MSNVAWAQSYQRPGKPFGQGTPGQEESSLGEPGSDAAGPIGFSSDQAAPGTATTPGAVSTAPPIDEPIDAAKYVCGPGDVFVLNFWGVQTFKIRVTIDLEGRAYVPRVGYFPLAGKTLAEARRLMRESVGRYYPRLSFDVTLAEPRTFMVQLIDDVPRAGSFPAHAVDRVAALIARAGGLPGGASQRRIEIRRRDGTALHVDLLKFSLTGDVKYNPYLLDGDVIRVPFEELAVEVSGAVNRPGRYELVGTRDLSELMELAGGLSPAATRQLPITLIRRVEDDRPRQMLLDFPSDAQLPTLALRHDDRLTFPNVAELQQAVTVIGAVQGAVAPPSATPTPSGAGQATAAVAPASEEASATRRVPFVRGETVRTLVQRVGGVGPLADLERAYVIRNGRPIGVDLHALITLRDLSADRPIELGDTLVIPFQRRSVLVEGAVFAPGSYPYNPTFRIEEYLALAGGRNRFAQPLDEVRVVLPSGQMNPYAPNVHVEPGSTVVVPERNFSRTEVVQLVLGAASVIISGVAVVIAASR